MLETRSLPCQYSSITGFLCGRLRAHFCLPRPAPTVGLGGRGSVGLGFRRGRVGPRTARKASFSQEALTLTTTETTCLQAEDQVRAPQAPGSTAPLSTEPLAEGAAQGQKHQKTRPLTSISYIGGPRMSLRAWKSMRIGISGGRPRSAVPPMDSGFVSRTCSLQPAGDPLRDSPDLHSRQSEHARDLPTRARGPASGDPPHHPPPDLVCPRPRPSAPVESQTFCLRGVSAVQLGVLVLSFCDLHSDGAADGPQLPVQRADPRLSGVPASKEQHDFRLNAPRRNGTSRVSARVLAHENPLGKHRNLLNVQPSSRPRRRKSRERQ